jgi:hypothetical protein
MLRVVPEISLLCKSKTGSQYIREGMYANHKKICVLDIPIPKFCGTDSLA